MLHPGHDHAHANKVGDRQDLDEPTAHQDQNKHAGDNREDHRADQQQPEAIALNGGQPAGINPLGRRLGLCARKSRLDQMVGQGCGAHA